MDLAVLLERLPLELVRRVFGFLRVQDDWRTLVTVVSHARGPVKAIAASRILRFVVVDPSCWARAFCRRDYWFPSIAELLAVLHAARDTPVRGTVQLCVHHNFARIGTQLEALLVRASRHPQLQFRLYMRDRHECICTCLSVARRCGVYRAITHFELASTTDTELNTAAGPFPLVEL
ncbi:hypothetical protein ABC855_g981 [[Candida] zeylanoides]